MTGILLFGAFLFVFWSGYLARGGIDSLRRNIQAQKRNERELAESLSRYETTGGLPKPNPDQHPDQY